MNDAKGDAETGGAIELSPLAAQQSSSTASASSSAATIATAHATAGVEADNASPSMFSILSSPCTNLDRYELAESFKDTMISSLPPQGSVDSDDLERTGYALHIAVAFQATFLFFLLFIGISDYQYNKKAEFLSPSPSEGDCESVPISVKNNYYADKYGHWDTEDQFQVATSTYFMYFSGVRFNEEEYIANMTAIKSKLQSLAERGEERDLAYTLTALGAYHVDGGGGSAMGLKYSVNPEIMFDYITGEHGISDPSGDCIPFGDTPIFADFNRELKSLIFRVKVSNGTEGAQACSQINALHFYPNEYAVDADGFVDFTFDIRSILTAVAVNRGILKVKDLRPLYSDLYGLYIYTDPAHSDMTPIYCIYGLKDTDPDSCLVITGNYYLLYPSIAQFGDSTSGLPCTCPYDPTKFEFDECNLNEIAINLVYLKNFSNEEYVEAYDNFSMKMAQYRVDDPLYGDINATEIARKAQLSSLKSFVDKISRNETFADLCRDVDCSLFHVRLYGEIGYTNVNTAGTQLAEYYADRNPGACKRALFNDTAFEHLLIKTPTPLEESYYVCTTPKTTAFQRAVGVAAGSATLYSSIVLSVMVFMLVRGFNMRNRSDPIVEPDEKRRRAETRISQVEINFSNLSNEFALLNKKYSDLVESNAKLMRQNEDLMKTLVHIRNEVIGVKVDVARSEHR